MIKCPADLITATIARSYLRICGLMRAFLVLVLSPAINPVVSTTRSKMPSIKECRRRKCPELCIIIFQGKNRGVCKAAGDRIPGKIICPKGYDERKEA